MILRCWIKSLGWKNVKIQCKIEFSRVKNWSDVFCEDEADLADMPS